MPNSYVRYADVDGVTQLFAIPFDYLARTHVEVRVDDVLLEVDEDYTYQSGTMLDIDPAPAEGTTVEVRRATPRDELFVEFSDGSTLTETDMNASQLQALYISQEAEDAAGDSLVVAGDGKYDAQDRIIKDLADPEDDQDAATKAYGDANWGGTAASNAAASAAAASTSANTASAQAAAAAISAAAAEAAAEDAADAAAVIPVPGAGDAGKMVRINATEDGYEKRTAVQVLSDIAAAAAAHTHVQDDITDLSMAGGVRQAFRGLHLRTHPDTPNSKVMLVRADEIIYDDGTRVTGWNTPESADITAAGASGLDTGSEAASTAYEIYAIGKSSDGTGTRAKTASDKIMLHVAKKWLADQANLTGAVFERLGDVTNRTRLAQGFQVATAGKVPHVDVRLFRNATPTGVFWFTIESDASGSPSGSALATSEEIPGTRVATTSSGVGGDIHRIIFRTPATLATATQYHLVMHTTDAIEATNYVAWGGTTANAYASGSAKTYNGTTWGTGAGFTDNATLDFLFRIYVEVESAVSMPATYDQKALIGHVVNNGSSNFKKFMAADRKVFTSVLTDWDLGAMTANVPVLFDLAQHVPARPTMVTLAGGHNAAAYIGIGPVTAYDVTSGGVITEFCHAINVPAVVLNTTYGEWFPPILSDAQAVLARSADTLRLWLAAYEWS